MNITTINSNMSIVIHLELTEYEETVLKGVYYWLDGVIGLIIGILGLIINCLAIYILRTKEDMKHMSTYLLFCLLMSQNIYHFSFQA